MSDGLFHQFFKMATRHDPFHYQTRLACGEKPEGKSEQEWLRQGTVCESKLINIPTGLGKTAAVTLAWLWNRVHLGDPKWPRRLVYCLPMRTLVEQTRDNVFEWVVRLAFAAAPDDPKIASAAERLSAEAQQRLKQDSDELRRQTAELASAKESLLWLVEHFPIILMGGEETDRENPWDAHPEREAILVGTQDMLLSRALNRGYGMSRYRWPMHFSLLNNDSLWIFDEVQLMGSGLPTTAQLEALRKKLGSIGECRSWWTSATSEREWLRTVDFDPVSLGDPHCLPNEDLASERVRNLLDAPKILAQATAGVDDLKTLAKEIVRTANAASGLSLVAVNTVKTARKLFGEILKLSRNADSKPLLLHSRFRPDDRVCVLKQALGSEGTQRIIVSTQVIEAGVDLSVAVLFTEIAPWSSLVQRFGRCNRRGTISDAKVYWFEAENASPYTGEQLSEARSRLNDPLRTDVSPASLTSLTIPKVDFPPTTHVIRRKDLVELFDTTPDLAGNDIDIDRWVREVEDSCVQIFWRTWEGSEKGRRPGAEGGRSPSRSELCSAPIGEFQDFIKRTKLPVWRWDYLEGEWVPVGPDGTYPGQSYLLPSWAGGYLSEMGWDPSSNKEVPPVAARQEISRDDSTDGERLSQAGVWQSVAEHTNQVYEFLETILERVPVEDASLLCNAARWHDWGKAHPAFQAKLRPERAAEKEHYLAGEPAAKAPDGAWLSAKLPEKPLDEEKRRKFFRHELASALGVLHPETPLPVSGEERDLVAYLIAAHHGKVRLSIRSLPGEWEPSDSRRFARGVWDEDEIPQTFLGGKAGEQITAPNCRLSLEPMELGLGENPPFTNLPSWSERMLALRDVFGPFKLAFLETLLRAADERASALASKLVLENDRYHESPRTNPAVAVASRAGAIAAADSAGPGEHLLEYVDGAGAGESRVAEGTSLPYGATRYIETTRGRLSYSEIAELLASRAAEIQMAVAGGAYADLPLDEFIVARIHGDLCESLIPGWAGRWRSVAVTVGVHEPPPPFQLAEAMRDYAADLRARWDFLLGDDESLLLETLAFAEGRFLTIHPFHDFNGRAVRLWLREILRRANLPELGLEVKNTEDKAIYFAALRAGDQCDYGPLKAVWRQRFAEAV